MFQPDSGSDSCWRALYQEREVLMLDEPTSNLDPVSVRHIAELLRGRARTVVVITHDITLASTFDMRYRFVDGGLVRDHGSVQIETAEAIHE